ncbi:hypothetical protein CEXT_147191 [Caerostris extrusa]|uniref:Uncharacterized protein n=1 Tax=Caerostris extrusa TaxID=172846 RepID=A0AAV4XZY9_CAEEX|nr:hypothetical protein CEXT_147191 [Caerostris extrusa]
MVASKFRIWVTPGSVRDTVAVARVLAFHQRTNTAAEEYRTTPSNNVGGWDKRTLLFYLNAVPLSPSVQGRLSISNISDSEKVVRKITGDRQFTFVQTLLQILCRKIVWRKKQIPQSNTRQGRPK